MSAIETMAPPRPVLAGLASVADRVSERAGAVDGGELDVRAALTELGDAGLLALGVADGPGTLTDQAHVLRTLARACMSTAFSAWAQRMAISYLATWGTDDLRATLLPGLVAGNRPGATALAAAFQAALGIGELQVEATADGDEVVLDGTVPWASNLFADGAAVVLPARTRSGQRLIVAITTDLAGVSLPAYPPLLALGATASTSLKLDGVRVPVSWVLTSRFNDFVTDVRPSFLLLQTSFCLGLADTALSGVEGRCEGVAEVFVADHERLSAQRARLDRQHHASLAAAQHEPIDLLRLRLAAARFAVEATQLESKVRGGGGYLASSPVARRVREATFLPIQSPTEAQLRWELSHSV